jgi:flagellar protein FliO/FliZ
MTATPSIWPALAAFAAVIVLIPVALWLLKRLQIGTQAAGQAVTLVGGLTLGPRERIAVIESQGRRWMIGITGQSISLLAELERTDVAAPSASAPAAPAATPTGFPPNPFAQMLDRLKRNG